MTLKSKNHGNTPKRALRFVCDFQSSWISYRFGLVQSVKVIFSSLSVANVLSFAKVLINNEVKKKLRPTHQLKGTVKPIPMKVRLSRQFVYSCFLCELTTFQKLPSMGVHHKRKQSQIKCNLKGIRCHTDLTQVRKTSCSLSSEKYLSKSKYHLQQKVIVLKRPK